MRTMIAIPALDTVRTEFFSSVCTMRHAGEVQFTVAQSSLTYDGRNLLAAAAIDGDFDRVLWLDSDILFPPDLEERLHADLDAGHEMVSALYFTRKPPLRPVVYKAVEMDRMPDGRQIPRADSWLDYPEETLFPVEACGFGAVMMRTSLLREVRDRYGLPFSPIMGFGEDLSFCMRMREMGRTVWCDSRIRVGHVGSCVYSAEGYRREQVQVVDL